MTLTDDAKAVVALTTRLGTRQRPSLTAQMWSELSQQLKDAHQRPSDLFDPSFDISNLPGVDIERGDRVRELMAESSTSLLEADELRHRGIWITTILDDRYPSHLRRALGKEAPPVLFGAGDCGLLTRQGIGIVGSRNVSEVGAQVARSMARRVAESGRTVVSGGARGVDHLSMNEAFLRDGTVVGVLADSLIGRIRKPDVLGALDEERICLVTQQAPSSGFSAGVAMARNKVIYGLSEVTVVIASDERAGGTWAGAEEALKKGYGNVAVWRGEGGGPGNRSLEERGAMAFTDVDQLAGQAGSVDNGEQLGFDLSAG